MQPTAITKKKLRVLYIQVPHGGGSLIAMYEMIKELNAEVEPVILCFYKNNFSQLLHSIPHCKVIYLFHQPFANKASSNTRFRFIPKPILLFIRTLRKNYVTDNKLVKTIYDIIIKEHPCIVHHNNDVGLNAVAIKAASKAGVIQITHNRSLTKFNNNPAAYFFYKGLAKKINYVINISQSVQDHYNHLFPSLKNKCTVINDFVDITKFKIATENNSIKKEFNIKENDFVISNIGRIIDWKGQHVLIEALNLIKDTINNYKVLIVGAHETGVGSNNYLEHLKRLTLKYGLEEKIIFTGNRNDIVNIIHSSDVIVHTAVESEPQGLVIIESLLCGKNIVASDAGGAAELINKYGGELVEPGNHSMLAEKILKLYTKKMNGFPTQNNINYQKLIDDFNPEDKKNQIINIYKQNYKSHV